MKAYGLPRDYNLQSPDVADILNFGLQPGKYGRKRKSSRQRRARREWKKDERLQQRRKVEKIKKDYNRGEEDYDAA